MRHISKEAWARAVGHTIEIEEKYWKADGLQDEMDRLIIHLESDDSDSSSDSSDGDSDCD